MVIAGVEATADANGVWGRDIPLQLSPNVIEVTATDEAGNAIGYCDHYRAGHRAAPPPPSKKPPKTIVTTTSTVRSQPTTTRAATTTSGLAHEQPRLRTDDGEGRDDNHDPGSRAAGWPRRLVDHLRRGATTAARGDHHGRHDHEVCWRRRPARRRRRLRRPRLTQATTTDPTTTDPPTTTGPAAHHRLPPPAPIRSAADAV